MSNLLIAIPTAGYVCSDFLNSLLEVQDYLKEEFEKSETRFFEGSVISANRYGAISYARKNGYSTILWMDNDMAFSKETIQALLKDKRKLDCPIIGCNYVMRGKPHYYTAMSLDKLNKVPTRRNSKEPEQVFALGFGLMFMDISITDGIQPPYFRTDESMTEDFFFFWKLQEQGGVSPPWISHRASKLITHVGKKRYTYLDGYEEDLEEIMVYKPTMEELMNGKKNNE